MCGRLKCCLRYELPNGKGVKHGGCADEGGCGSCSNPTGPGGAAAAARADPAAAGRAGERSAAHRRHRRRSRRDRAGDRAQGGGRSARCRRSARSSSTDRRTTETSRGSSAAASRRRRDAPRTTPIVAATRDAQAGRIDAIATAPINKEAFAAAGLPWRGHTDLLAHLTGAPRVAMMFYAESLRVVLATVHIALADVPRALTREVLEGTIELAARELPRFGFLAPRTRARRPEPACGRARRHRPRRR